MIKKVIYFLSAILVLLVLVGLLGIRWFNNLWFEEKPNYLSYESDSIHLDFKWAKETYGDHLEEHVAMMIPVSVTGIKRQFYLQFDTGAPFTLIYGNTLASLKEYGLPMNKIQVDGKSYLENIQLSFGDHELDIDSIQILNNYGTAYDQNDTITKIKLGTIGADFIDQRVCVINFKSKYIELHKERPSWMHALTSFQSFDFQGRRLMLPVTIDNKKLELFYDSGCSAFGMITSKDRYEKYTDIDTKEISYKGNRFGESVPIFHKYSDKKMKIGETDLSLRRISYVDMYASYQKFMTPFTKIGGWLGNKPFLESTLVLDCQKEEFAVIKFMD